MINTDMRDYKYYTYIVENEYGQSTISKDVKGTVKMAIYVVSNTKEDSVNYTSIQYQGITLDTDIDDTYVIKYGNKKLKVLYVIDGRYRQVIMTRM